MSLEACFKVFESPIVEAQSGTIQNFLRKSVRNEVHSC